MRKERLKTAHITPLWRRGLIHPQNFVYFCICTKPSRLIEFSKDDSVWITTWTNPLAQILRLLNLRLPQHLKQRLPQPRLPHLLLASSACAAGWVSKVPRLRTAMATMVAPSLTAMPPMAGIGSFRWWLNRICKVYETFFVSIMDNMSIVFGTILRTYSPFLYRFIVGILG